MMMFPLRITIAIPVKNEAAHIGACLHALCHQTVKFDRLVLVLNNCTDASLRICRQIAAQRNGIDIFEETLHGTLASAGEARRRALCHAAASEWESLILTTDADAVVDPFWIERNVSEIEAGAHVVCGAAEIDPQDAKHIPSALHEDDRQESLLLALLDEITALLNPEPYDPWPRHQQESGASIAVRQDILHLAGGAPHVATCEDRVLVDRLRLVDARIRHAPDIVVRVSGRMEGRAAGGMAETIKRRIIQQDQFTDEKLEPAIDAFRRAMAQARLRNAWQGLENIAALAQDLLIEPSLMRHLLGQEFFGQVWAAVQAESPVLRRRRVAFAAVPRQIVAATALRDRLRAEIPGAPQQARARQRSDA